MSVINQMLVDLEERRAADRPAIEARQSAYIAAGAPRRTRRAPPFVVWGVAALAVAAVLLAVLRMPFSDATQLLDRAVSRAVADTRNVAGQPPASQPVTAAAVAATPRLNPHPPLSFVQAALAAREPAAETVGETERAPESEVAGREPAAEPARPVADRSEHRPAPAAASRKTPAEAKLVTASTKPPVANKTAPASEARSQLKIVPRKPSPEQRFARLLGEARKALAQGDTARADARVREALRLAPGNAAAAELLFAVQLRTGDSEAAIATLHELLLRDPYNIGYAQALARLLAGRGEHRRAVERLRNALAGGRGDGQSLALLAALERRIGDHEAAAAHYLDALSHNRSVAVWWLGLGMSLESLQQPAQAHAAFAEAQRIGGLDGEVAAFVEQRLAELDAHVER